MARWLAILALVVSAYGYGAASHERRWFPTPQIERALRQAVWWFRPERGFNETSGRQRVECAPAAGPRTAVLLTLGQSNAANEGEGPYSPRSPAINFNFLDGHCYDAKEPLLGTTGNRASVWTRVADGLIARGAYERVVIAPIAVGGTGIARWAAGGDLNPRIGRALRGLSDAGLRPTHILWHQGENDAGKLDRETYVTRFGEIVAAIRAAGGEAPIYVAVASLCGDSGNDEIRNAQREIPNRFAGVKPGPDTDTLDRFVWRRDLCHFSSEGLDRHAELWLDVLAR